MGLFRKGLKIINKIINQFLIILIILTIFISIFFIPQTESTINNEKQIINYIETGELLWPAPGYYRINSYFGKRNAPTRGASTFHKGIDIGAPEGSEYIAVTNGTVTYSGFLGGGGYTLTITDEKTKNGEVKYSYCHSDPKYMLPIGEKVLKGQIIGRVGPKNVYGVPGNRYYDSSGNPTNGATTGPHLHFGMRINGEYVNPLNYLPNN